MRTSWILTVLILAGAGGLYFYRRGETAGLRREIKVVQGEVAAAGLDPVAAAKGEAARVAGAGTGSVTLASADQKTAVEKAALFAQELIAFALEMESKKGKGAMGPDPETQKRIFAIMGRFAELDEAGLKIVVEELEKSTALKDRQKQEVVGMSIMMLAQSSPESALRLLSGAGGLMKEEGGNHSKMLVSMCVSSWAQKDPAAALAWMDKKENAELLDDNARMMALGGLAKKDAVLALQTLLARKSDKPGDQNGPASMIGQNAAPDQRMALLEAANKEPDASLSPEERKGAKERSEQVRNTLLAGIGSGLTQGNFEESVKWLKDAPLSEKDRNRLAVGVGNSLWGQEPSKWLGWIGENVKEESDLVQATSSAISGWTDRDYNAVGEWLDAQPSGSLRTVGTAQFARTLAPHEPESAATWALTLPETYADRENVLREVTGKWREKDAAAADAFAAEHGIK